MNKYILSIFLSLLIIISNITEVKAAYRKNASDVKFSDYPKVIELYIGDELTESANRTGYFVVNDFHYLRSIYVSENNENFSSFDGVLYNKDRTKLVLFPQGRDIAAIPKTCVKLEAGCMYGLSASLRRQIKAVITKNNGGKYPGFDKEIVDPKRDALYIGVMEVTVDE